MNTSQRLEAVAELTGMLCAQVAKRGTLTTRGAHLCAIAAGHLRRIAASLSSLAEHECNYGLTKIQERRRASLTADAMAIVEPFGLGIRVDGDPRGYVLCLVGDGVRGNTMGGDEHGFGVAS